MSALYYPQGVSAHPPPPPSAATASHSNVTSRTALASAGHHAHHLAAAAAQRSAKRLPRLPLLQQSHASRSFRHAGSPRESFEPSLISTYRRDFDAARSFELDDDELFCPFHLLTEDDVRSCSCPSALTVVVGV